MTITCNTVDDLQFVSEKLLHLFPKARIFALAGSMGAGKTTLIKILCRNLGVEDIVQSPSFSIVNEYKTTSGETVFHFDFYRIRKIDEVFDLGYEEYLFSGAYCFIEWPELMEELLPDGAVKVTIDVNSGNGLRSVSF